VTTIELSVEVGHRFAARFSLLAARASLLAILAARLRSE